MSTSSWGNLRQDEVTWTRRRLLGAPSSIGETVLQHRFTQEVRLAGSAPSWLDWTIGGYYTREHDTILQNLGLNDAATTGQAIAAASGLETRRPADELSGDSRASATARSTSARCST